MAWGKQQRQPAQGIIVEFDHAGRTYTVELPGSNDSGDPEGPHPLVMQRYFESLWKFTDLRSGQTIYGSLSDFGPIRIPPPQQPRSGG